MEKKLEANKIIIINRISKLELENIESMNN